MKIPKGWKEASLVGAPLAGLSLLVVFISHLPNLSDRLVVGSLVLFSTASLVFLAWLLCMPKK